MKPIDKLRNLAIIPEEDINLFLNRVNMRNSTVSVTSMADLIVTNPFEIKQYTYEQFIDNMIAIKSNLTYEEVVTDG